MSEPNEFPPPPFTPAPLELSERSGCRKALLFGCGGLFLILALSLVVAVVKAPEILGAMLGYLEQDYAAKLAPDVSAAERARFHRAFEAAQANPIKVMQDSEGLERFRDRLLGLSAKTQLSREDAAGLSALLEKMSGTASTPTPGPDREAPAPPAPVPPPAPNSHPSPTEGAGPRPTTA
ncbi:MAG TPA: hypothetical protein VN851_18770 [Thermoanaerobaculia bacterium]|nr:hypothetical protein [Thermoanaerobaculia bacterium]